MRTVPVLLLLLVAGCAGEPGCGPTTSQSCVADRTTAGLVAGRWRTLDAPAGLSLTLQLTANDTTLVGKGFLASGSAAVPADVRGFVTWREPLATPAGPSPAGPLVILDLSLAGGGTARFDQGSMKGDTLLGALTLSTDPTRSYGISLVR